LKIEIKNQLFIKKKNEITIIIQYLKIEADFVLLALCQMVQKEKQQLVKNSYVIIVDF
jgi:hypothetical protein